MYSILLGSTPGGIKMKKIIALILASVMICLAFAACSSKSTDETADKSKTTGTAAATEAKTEGGDETTEEAADAASDLQYVKDKGNLVIGITEYEPMNYQDADGKWTGFDTEFAEAVAAKLGVTAEFVVIDWDNKFWELNSKSIDCVWNGMTINENATKNSDVSDPYVKNAQVVVVASDKIADYADVEAMKDLTFAVEAGSAGADAVAELGYNMVEVNTQADALLEVSSGSADACVIDITMANAMTGEGTSYASLGAAFELNSEEYGIAFRKGSDMVAEVNKIMAELMSDGTLDALAEKYELTLVK